jgi:hypothetical protein
MGNETFGVGYNNTTKNYGSGLGGIGLDLSSYLTDDLVKNVSGIDKIFNNEFSKPSYANPYMSTMSIGGIPQLGNTNNSFLGNTKDFFSNFNDKYLNRDFLLGTDKQLGFLPVANGLAQTIGGLYNANRQYNFGKRQYEDQKKIYNQQQQRLYDDSVKRANLILQNSSFDDNWSQDKKDEYIRNKTVQPKFI